MNELMKQIHDKLTPEERQYMDAALSKMFEDGFGYGYRTAKNELWILTEKDLPRSEEKVEATIRTKTGGTSCVTAKYINGKWTGSAKGREVLAWRPASVPYDPKIENAKA